MPKGDREKLRADLKDGYAELSNLLLERLCSAAPLTGSEHQVVWFIIRRTYGWRKRKGKCHGGYDVMTAKDIALGTCAPARTIEKALSNLVRIHVILAIPTSERIGCERAYGLNVATDEWGGNDPEWIEVRRRWREAEQRGAYVCHDSVPIPETAYCQYSKSGTADTPNRVVTDDFSPTAPGSEATPKARTEKARTESESPVENPVENSGAPPPEPSDSGSGLAPLAGEITARLGAPREARQLATWAGRNGVTAGMLQAAGEMTQQAQGNGGLEKPVAYLQTVARRLQAGHVEQEQERQHDADRTLQAAVACARSVYADPILGGNWRTALAVTAESYGGHVTKLAAAALEQPMPGAVGEAGA